MVFHLASNSSVDNKRQYSFHKKKIVNEGNVNLKKFILSKK